MGTALCLAQNTKENITADAKLFKDSACSKLKTDVWNTTKFKSDAMKDMAEKMIKKEYKPDYLMAEYEAYPTPQVIGKTLKLGDGFSKYENMTGVFLDKGQHVIIVGETKGRPIKLLLPNWMRKPAEGVEPTKDPNGWGLHKTEVPLQEGVNIIDVEIPTNAYISYFADDYEKAPKIPVHFVTGKVNGYFDATRGDTNEMWDKLLENAVSPIMDARGKYIQVAYPVEWFKVYASGKGKELMNAYDKLVGAQYELMGLKKYKKIPKNRVLARVNFNYYMFRDGDGVAYNGDKGTMGMVVNPESVVKGDPCWGFSHEVGHVMQMRPMTWGGMTEVSNNIFSLYCAAVTDNPSRLQEGNSYKRALETLHGKGVSHLSVPDVFVRLVPLWQLHLYFTKNGHPDFYGDVMEILRNNKQEHNGNDSINYQFEFIKACCDATKTDLTDFFDKWGYFWVGDIEVGDYGNYSFKITQKMVDDTKKYIASKKYKKPKDDIALVNEDAPVPASSTQEATLETSAKK